MDAKFQSSPIPKDGRYAPPKASDVLHAAVSILAHPEGRALQEINDLKLKYLKVSILAHPEGRALRQYRC